MNINNYLDKDFYHKIVFKWNSYFDIYNKYLEKFVNKRVRLLEIGTGDGGSSLLFRDWLGLDSEVVTIDIKDKESKFDRIFSEKGDQKDSNFLTEIHNKYGGFDIVIDDGGHRMEQQIESFKTLYPLLNEHGVYIIEDLHTSYWKKYGGGLNKKNTTIDFLKNLIDVLHSDHFKNGEKVSFQELKEDIFSLHFYDSIVVIEKEKHDKIFQTRNYV